MFDLGRRGDCGRQLADLVLALGRGAERCSTSATAVPARRPRAPRRTPAPAWRHVMVGAGIAVVLGGAATAGFLISHHRAAQAAAMPKPKCTGIATRLAGVWDAATKAGVEHGFASKRSFACLYHATGSYYDKYELTTSKGIPVTMDFKDAGHYRVTGRLAARGIARVRPR